MDLGLWYLIIKSSKFSETLLGRKVDKNVRASDNVLQQVAKGYKRFRTLAVLDFKCFLHRRRQVVITS